MVESILIFSLVLMFIITVAWLNSKYAKNIKENELLSELPKMDEPKNDGTESTEERLINAIRQNTLVTINKSNEIKTSISYACLWLTILTILFGIYLFWYPDLQKYNSIHKINRIYDEFGTQINDNIYDINLNKVGTSVVTDDEDNVITTPEYGNGKDYSIGDNNANPR